MKTAAIIAEYNPFHLGHAWQLQEIKKNYGATLIVIMSGNYVQRGTPAIVDKFTRAKWALQNGADIVFELPSIFATAGAEQFASGACMLLDKLGFIDMLFFGSELENNTTDISYIIEKIAAILIDPPSSYKNNLKKFLSEGNSFAAAREKALYPILSKEIEFQKYINYGRKETPQELFHAIISAPNTILGIEYCKALKQRNSSIKPIPLQRKGNYHSTFLPKQINFAINSNKIELEPISISASAIRNHLFSCPDSFQSLSSFLPQTVFADLPSLTFLHENDISSCLYYTLLFQTIEELTTYHEISFDLAKRIVHYLPQFQDFSSFIALLKTKNYTYARISRALLHAFLSIKKEEPFQECSFLRLLGLKKESSCLLRKVEEQTGLTIITKASSASKKFLSNNIINNRNSNHNNINRNKNDYAIFQKEIAASQLYGFLSYKKGNIAKPYRELATSPIIL